MTNTKNYKHASKDMLIASKTIAHSFQDNIQELSLVRTNWTEEYAVSVVNKIDDTFEEFLGGDNLKEQRNATAKLHSIEQPATQLLSFLKVQIEVDFGHEAKEILKQLGYSSNLSNLKNESQEVLTQTLYSFKKGMTPDLKQRIVDKGTNPDLIDKLIGFATVFNEANVSQELKKSASKEFTSEAISAFNAVYDEIIGICKIASRYYQYDELKKELFTFSKVIAKMKSPSSKKTSETEES